MVWPFKKRKDVIDLTYLAKRGLIKLPEKDKEEYKEINPMQLSSQDNNSGGDALSFLSGLASSGSSEPLPLDEKRGLSKNKIEDFEFKLDNMRKKIDQLIDRIDLVEKKLARNERLG